MGSDGAFANFRLAGATEKNGTLLGGPGVVRRGGAPQTPSGATSGPFGPKKRAFGEGRTFLPSHDLGGKLPIRPAGLATLCGECGQWPSSTARCKMLTAFRGEAIRGTRTMTNGCVALAGFARSYSHAPHSGDSSQEEAALRWVCTGLEYRRGAPPEGRMARLG